MIRVFILFVSHLIINFREKIYTSRTTKACLNITIIYNTHHKLSFGISDTELSSNRSSVITSLLSNFVQNRNMNDTTFDTVRVIANPDWIQKKTTYTIFFQLRNTI